jgi:hypothetical protein
MVHAITRRREHSQCRIDRVNLDVKRRINRPVRDGIGALDSSNLDQGGRDHRIRELPQRSFVQRRKSRRSWNNRATSELFTSVHHVDVVGTTCKCPVVQLFGIVALADVDDERDDVRVVLIGEPSHSRTRRRMSIKREDDALIVHGWA